MRRDQETVRRPPPVPIVVDGSTVNAYPGESLAVALLASGVRAFRRAANGAPRGPFCNMGVCFECVVTIDGASARACMTAVRAGMSVETGSSSGAD